MQSQHERLAFHMKTLDAATASRFDAVAKARRETLKDLAAHDRFVAGFALARGAWPAYNDFMTMRGAILAGGLHRVRLTGGRGIDG